METKNSNILEATDCAVREVIHAFQKNPYQFLYESDLQSSLYAAIKKLLPGTVSVQGTGHPLANYELAPVYTEYGQRIDIACLDVESAQAHPTRIHAGIDTHIWELPVLVGIEIKYRKLGDRYICIDKCLADHDKLIALRVDNPLVLGFIQHAQDVDCFFDTMHDRWARTQPTDADPLWGVIIIAPNKVWQVDVL